MYRTVNLNEKQVKDNSKKFFLEANDDMVAISNVLRHDLNDESLKFAKDLIQ